jgi:glucose dehydrogenase
MNSRYRLIELDAKTGKPVAGFGDNGVVNLLAGLPWEVNPKHYTNTSPPVVCGHHRLTAGVDDPRQEQCWRAAIPGVGVMQSAGSFATL